MAASCISGGRLSFIAGGCPVPWVVEMKGQQILKCPRDSAYSFAQDYPSKETPKTAVNLCCTNCAARKKNCNNRYTETIDCAVYTGNCRQVIAESALQLSDDISRLISPISMPYPNGRLSFGNVLAPNNYFGRFNVLMSKIVRHCWERAVSPLWVTHWGDCIMPTKAALARQLMDISANGHLG